jgi:tetratricopeptide (TPR) repeat protein
VVLLLAPAAAFAQSAPSPAAPPPSAGAAPAVISPTDSPDVELAKSHFNTGQLDYEQKRFAEAAREFEEAFRLSPRSPLLYNIGKSYDGAGDHARALEAYRRYLLIPDTVDSPDRPVVLARVALLEHLVGRLTIHTAAGAQLTLDGAPLGTAPHAPVEVNPGAHTLTASREGYRTFRGKFVAAPDRAVTVLAPLASLMQVKVVEVPRAEKPTPLYKKWWLWTAVGVVVAAGAVTAGVLGSQTPPVSGPFAQLPEVR